MLKQCQFFASSKGCKYGENCRFSHSNSQSRPICKSYLSEKCRYGDRCKFSHVDHDSSLNAKTKQKPSKANKGTHHKKICSLYQQNQCRYGNKCKFLHSKLRKNVKNETKSKNKSLQKRDDNKQYKIIKDRKNGKSRCKYGKKYPNTMHQNNNDKHIELKNLNIYLKYNGMVHSADYFGSNTLYFYYDTGSKHISFMREVDGQMQEYNTDIIIAKDDILSEYSCGLVEGNYLFVQHNNIIYKCMKWNTFLVDNKLVFIYKKMNQVQLKNYENNIELISDNYDITSEYYTIHDICICNDAREYIMLYTLYISTTNLVKITDIQIFDVTNKIECAYHVNKYDALSMDYMEKRLSLGQFYWFNTRALFYEEYNSKTGLGQLCVGWDSIDLFKSNRDILASYLSGINHLVNIVFEFVSTFNFIDKKRIIFHNISNIKIDQRNAILYVNYFNKGTTRNWKSNCYKILCK